MSELRVQKSRAPFTNWVRVVVKSQVISEATLRVAIPWYLHLYTFPFLGFYLLFASIRYVRHSSSLWSEESAFFAFVLLLTGHSLTFLATRWNTAAQALITTFDASKLQVADYVRITPIMHRGNGEIVPLIKENPPDVSTWTFKYQAVTYAVVESHPTTFAPLAYPCSDEPLISTLLRFGGLTQEEVEQRTKKFGTNELPIPIPTFAQLFLIHLTAPLAIYQAFCAILLLSFAEYVNPLLSLLALVCSESMAVRKRLEVLEKFRDMAPHPFNIRCKRDGNWVTISTDKLLPGDVVFVNFNKQMSPADILLIQGTCTVDEATLSGESMSLSKKAISCRKATERLKVDSAHKSSMLYGGTELLESCSCIGVVQRTGFGTSQGQVIRDMVFSPEKVSANNLESYLFMGSLMTFSMVISRYVWVKGFEKGLKKSRLLLQCLSIITSTVPVSLPLELSLAIGVSLDALSDSGVRCAEPFRIPFAGRVDACCFDKTGTLTNSKLVLGGMAGVGPYATTLVNVQNVERETTLTLAAAQALIKFHESLVGDPMEMVVLKAIGWTLKDDKTICNGHGTRVVIQRRFPFTSTLRRMSTVSRVHSENENRLICAVKGAPETIKAMLTVVPEHYQETYEFYARTGHRVLALGFKKMDGLNDEEIGELTRDHTERDLSFAGFLVFSCALEEGVPELIETLTQSSHRCIMITGDNPLTAVHVATKVKIVDRDVLILDLSGNPERPNDLAWRTVDDRKIIPVNPEEPPDSSLFDQYDICITGAALQQYECRPEAWSYLVQNTWVYARASPSQKEFILRSLKSLGYITSMVGDGTNDIGALKQAHVGISLNSAYDHIFPGDGQSFASCAAPFGCGSVVAVPSILKQGRRGLVVTIQAYKILALNGLIRACSLAVQYLYEIRLSTHQIVMARLFAGVCSFFISRTKPAERLSQERPLEGILNSYVLLSVALQSALHMVTLMYITNLAHLLEVRGVSDMGAEFEPSLLGTAIYLLSHSQTISTFVINYQGMPFRKGIQENPGLCLGFIGAAATAIVSLASFTPQVSRLSQVAEMSHHFRARLAATMIFDYIGCWFVERGCRYLLVSPKENGLVTKRQKRACAETVM